MIFTSNDLMVIASVSDAEPSMTHDEARDAVRWFLHKYKELMEKESQFSCVNCECAVCTKLRLNK